MNEDNRNDSAKLPRRRFLKGALAVPALTALPGFLLRTAWAEGAGDRVLVLVQLAGGNDGLNTVIPYERDSYYRARPGLGVPQKSVLKLADGIGLHPSLSGLREAWDDGSLGVLQGVGYPNPDRSHFTSTDIWHTAQTEGDGRTGWIGRALDTQPVPKGGGPAGLHLGDETLSLALVGRKVMVPSVRDARRFRIQGSRDSVALIREMAALDKVRAKGDDLLRFVGRSAERAYETADRLEKSLTGDGGGEGYPNHPLGRRLHQVARLIDGGLGARVYAVSLNGFDTHSQQAPVHQGLLKILGDALGAFHKELQARKLQDRVLVMTYSEFGRRVKENRSLGTDHGAAAPLFVMGGKARGGLHGKHPSLTDLLDGDLKFHTDFRQVYATVLRDWMGLNAQTGNRVLGGTYKPVPILRT